MTSSILDLPTVGTFSVIAPSLGVSPSAVAFIGRTLRGELAKTKRYERVPNGDRNANGFHNLLILKTTVADGRKF
jgi:hypothetical protein